MYELQDYEQDLPAFAALQTVKKAKESIELCWQVFSKSYLLSNYFYATIETSPAYNTRRLIEPSKRTETLLKESIHNITDPYTALRQMDTDLTEQILLINPDEDFDFYFELIAENRDSVKIPDALLSVMDNLFHSNPANISKNRYTLLINDIGQFEIHFSSQALLNKFIKQFSPDSELDFLELISDIDNA